MPSPKEVNIAPPALTKARAFELVRMWLTDCALTAPAAHQKHYALHLEDRLSDLERVFQEAR